MIFSSSMSKIMNDVREKILERKVRSSKVVSKAQIWTSRLHTRKFKMVEGSLCFWEICL